MAALTSRGDGVSDTLQPKDLFRREDVVASAAHPNIVDRRSATEGMRDAMVELEKESTLAAPTRFVHVDALSRVALPDLSTHPSWEVT